MTRYWQPGDVALVLCSDDEWRQATCEPHPNIAQMYVWRFSDRVYRHTSNSIARPLLVIDPEDREQVMSLLKAYHATYPMSRPADVNEIHADHLAAALRSLIEPPKPEEPTDPKAWVTDRRDNTWRLLADGDWVCISGPDVGEYLDWNRLSTDRGPVSIEVMS